MQPPHYSELIYAVNSKKCNVTLYDGYGYLGQDIYCLTYFVKNKIYATEVAQLGFYEKKGIQFLPKHIFAPTRNIDRRKNKMFKFEDYADVYSLADDLVAYIENVTENYFITKKCIPGTTTVVPTIPQTMVFTRTRCPAKDIEYGRFSL